MAGTEIRTDPAIVRRMFNRVAPRYDLLNRVLSFGCDAGWRRRLAAAATHPTGSGARVLDLATGTGDVVLALRRTGRCALAAGMDMAEAMLGVAHAKLYGEAQCGWVLGDALDAPFATGAFDAVTLAFGLRNFADLDAGLREIRRVLKPGGRALVLEFSLPKNRLMRFGYLVYLRYAVPLIGGILSGHREAYAYLNRTIEAFPQGATLCARMEQAGFKETRALPLTFGVATLYEGTNP